MRDILDELLTAERMRQTWAHAHAPELTVRIDKLLSIIRERIAAGDKCARELRKHGFTAEPALHARAVKACDDAVRKEEVVE